MSTQTPKIEKVISPAATLRAMKSGTVLRVSTRDIKTNSLRSAADRLKRYGYSFHVTEAGLVNETLITCVKSPKL